MRNTVSRISLALVLTVFLAGILPRALFFLAGPGPLENWLGEALRIEFHIFLTAAGFLYLHMVQDKTLLWILAILLGWISLRCVRFLQTGRPLFPPETLIVVAPAAVFLQFFSDMSLKLFIACVVASVFAFRSRVWNGKLLTFAAAVFPFCAYCFWLDIAESIGLLFLTGAAWLLGFVVHRRKITPASAAIAFIICLPLAQMIASWLPSLVRHQQATRFSPQSALSFCESKKHASLFVTHPQCPTTMFARQCRNAFIGVYDLKDLAPRREIHPFHARYFGRPEQLVCRDPYLIAGMNGVRIDGFNVGANTLLAESASAHGPERIKENFAAPGVGNSLAYDARNDALYMSAEFDHRIYRWDFVKRLMQPDIGDALQNPWYRVLTGTTQTGSWISHHDGLSYKKNSVYFAEWINGRFVHEVDLTTQRPRRNFRFNGGASVGATVDDERSRLWVSHLWGVSVFDLDSGKLLAKHRAGFMNRPAVIDSVNNLVFLGATISGRIHVFDRASMKPLTTLALGTGTRYLLVSPEYRRLYAASWSGSYAFDLSPDGDFVKAMVRFRERS